MSDLRNDATPSCLVEERASFSEQWSQRNTTLESHADIINEAQPPENERSPQFSAWNWVMIVAMVISLGWYITRLPATLGPH
jgi:hypothetical protein